MKRITITSILALCMVCPSFADIGKNESNPTCDDTTIGATSGTTNLEAQWTANTINLDYYADDTKLSTGSCQYDSGITLPSDPTPPTGYVFSGWQVRTAAPAQTPITLSTLYSSESINVFSSKSLNPGVYCEGSSGWDSENYDYAWYGTDEQGEGACSNSAFNGLNNGEWRVTMPNGNVVKGEARCSTVNGTYAQTGSPTDDLDLTNLNNGARYCWCKATSADTGSGSYIPVASSSWVFDGGHGGAGDCARVCAYDCARYVGGNDDFRRAVFGVSQ